MNISFEEKLETGFRLLRFRDAYLRMADEARYRPQAPSDGCGNICLTVSQFRDPERLAREADAYAYAFAAEEDTCSFWIGCSDYRTNQAFVFVIEAARQLATGNDGNATARTLLRMAIKEIEGK